MVIKILNITVIFLLISISKCFAYFDPGTGSHIIQAIISFFSLIIFYFLITLTFIKNIFYNFYNSILSKFFKKKKDNEDKSQNIK